MTLKIRIFTSLLPVWAGFFLSGAPAYGQVYHDTFDDSLGEWVFWTDAQPADPHSYSLAFDLQDGTPAPCAMVSGDYDVLAGSGSKHFGMQRGFDTVMYLSLSFDWRAASGWMSVTNLGLSATDASTGETLYSEILMPGGSLDTGWQHYPLRNLSSILGGQAREIIIRFYMVDSWTANWSQTFHIDNFELRAEVPRQPPLVPFKTDNFNGGLNGWTFYTDIDAGSGHTYSLAIDGADGSPAPSAIVSGTYPYSQHAHGHMFGMEKDFAVSYPFVITFDWEGSAGVWPTMQVLSEGRILFTMTLANRSAGTWRLVEPFDVSEALGNVQNATLRFIIAGTGGEANHVHVDNFAVTAGCGELEDGHFCVDDGNSCTDDKCAGGQCVHPAVLDGTACGEEFPCWVGPFCSGGACGEQTARVCDDPPECRTAEASRCNPLSGACEYPASRNGSPCEDDGNSCTQDICNGGECSHPAALDNTPCAGDGDPCTEDVCRAGECAHPELEPGTGTCPSNPVDDAGVRDSGQPAGDQDGGIVPPLPDGGPDSSLIDGGPDALVPFRDGGSKHDSGEDRTSDASSGKILDAVGGCGCSGGGGVDAKGMPLISFLLAVAGMKGRRKVRGAGRARPSR